MLAFDFFAGRRGWSRKWEDRGHTVVSTDIDPAFDVTFHADILELTAEYLLERFGRPDFVLASPPCEGMSVGSLYRHWDLPGGRGTQGVPKSDTSRLGVRLAEHTLELIAGLQPRFGFVLENPTGMMRHVLGFTEGSMYGLNWKRWLHADAGSPKAPSVTYCTLGFNYKKPTDLWVGGRFVRELDLPAPCKTDSKATVEVPGEENLYRVNLRTGEPCHEKAERGARTGVQGLADYATRSVVPDDLSLAVCLAAERSKKNSRVLIRRPQESSFVA